ncbi:MAG TPA: lipid-binding SYLF domain-containing protein [Bordetella sp.]|nr:lipid-binding SYLF domain-containing protein [Bordetella sp.]
MIKHLRQIVAIPLLLLVVACSTQSGSSGQGDPELESKSRAALNKLFETTPKAENLRYNAVAVVVFPDILKAGLILGGQGGNGVMFGKKGEVLGYYNVAAVSWGLQAGAQTFSEAMFLMNDSAVSYLNSSDGWSVGVGPSIVVVDEGAAKSLTTSTMQSDVYAFIYGQQGLMAGLGVQGQKITKLNR